MVRFQGVGVRGPEGGGQLVGAVGEVVAQRLGGEVEASVLSFVRAFAFAEMGWGATDRMSQSRPSAATCFLVLSSLMTRDWRFSDSAGAASWRSRTFLLSVS